MNRSIKLTLTTACFFLPSSLALAYFVFYLATFPPTSADARTAATTATEKHVPPSSDNVTLSKNRSQRIGKIELTYRGMDADSVVIDIALLYLEPDYAYRRKIPKKSAENGFWLAQQYYQLVTANSIKLTLAHING